MTTMTDELLARLRAHRNNIHRYRRLLTTALTGLEREFIERRLAEEWATVEALSDSAFPFTVIPAERDRFSSRAD